MILQLVSIFKLEVIKNLLTYENLNKIVYSFLLTTLFYIPGLVYTLRNISDKDKNFYINIIFILIINNNIIYILLYKILKILLIKI